MTMVWILVTAVGLFAFAATFYAGMRHERRARWRRLIPQDPSGAPAVIHKPAGKPRPDLGQKWALNGREGVIVKMLPGGGGDMGIAVFEGDVPPAHVSSMLHFPAYEYKGAAS